MHRKPITKQDYEQRINLLIEYINTHLHESIDLERLAGLSGFSRWHFHRITRAFLGEPIGAYIQRIRMETAARLLRYSHLSVEQIAYRVGYEVPSSLTKAFRACYGISPSYYRNHKNHVIMQPIELRPELDITMEIRRMKPKHIIYVRLAGTYAQLNYAAAWEKLFHFVHTENLVLEAPEFICIYHDDPKVTTPEKLRTDVCLTLPDSGAAKGEIGVKVIPGGTYAIFRYKGSYQQLNAVYDTIYGKWIPDQGISIGEEPGYENYLNHPKDTLPENLLTEICIPLAE